jgi:hypothetical protein
VAHVSGQYCVECCCVSQRELVRALAGICSVQYSCTCVPASSACATGKATTQPWHMCVRKPGACVLWYVSFDAFLLAANHAGICSTKHSCTMQLPSRLGVLLLSRCECARNIPTVAVWCRLGVHAVHETARRAWDSMRHKSDATSTAQQIEGAADKHAPLLVAAGWWMHAMHRTNSMHH